MAKFFWILTFVVVVLSTISGLLDSQNVLDMLYTVMWCSWGPIALATIYQLFEKKGALVQYIIAAAFVGATGFALYILSITASMVFSSGALNEGGIIFIVMPFGFVKYSLIGGICGASIYFLLRLYRT